MSATEQTAPLHKITALFTEQSVTAVSRAAAITGDTETDTLNRAAQIYDQLVAAVAQGARVLIAWPDSQEQVDIAPGAQP